MITINEQPNKYYVTFFIPGKTAAKEFLTNAYGYGSVCTTKSRLHYVEKPSQIGSKVIELKPNEHATPDTFKKYINTTYKLIAWSKIEI